MPDLSSVDLRFFVVVARAPSLAAAARELDVSRSAVTQRLRQLEQRLGCLLLERSTRHLRVTAEGQLLLERARKLLAELDEITGILNLRRQVISGHLRVAAPLGFGRRYLTPLLAEFRERHPSVEVSLTLTDHPVSVDEGHWDVVVHIGELRDSSIVRVRLAPNERFLVASPGYVATRGEPTVPADLVRHECLALRQNDEDVTLWRFMDRQRRTFPVRIAPAMSANDGEVVRLWALLGRGLVVRSEWDVADDLRSGRLVRVLPRLRLPSADVVALLHKRGGRTARASAFLGLLQDSLRPVPWRREV